MHAYMHHVVGARAFNIINSGFRGEALVGMRSSFSRINAVAINNK